MISSSDILHGKVLIVDDQEASVLLLERMLRGAGYVSITSTMDAECGAISGVIGRCPAGTSLLHLTGCCEERTSPSTLPSLRSPELHRHGFDVLSHRRHRYSPLVADFRTGQLAPGQQTDDLFLGT